MKQLTELIREDMRPALGVTEPGAIAYIMAVAREQLGEKALRAELYLNSGMYKNAFSCGIPNSAHNGNVYAAALGLVGGDAARGLEALAAITPEQERQAEALVAGGAVKVFLDHMGSEIYLRAVVSGESSSCEAIIQHSHTNLVYLARNGEVLRDTRAPQTASAEAESAAIHGYTLHELLRYAETVDAAEIDFIREAFRMNLALLEEGLASPRAGFAAALLAANGGERISEDERATAQLLCSGAIEARVIGLSRPAMSITGSGAHGIICTMPLYGYAAIHALGEERLCRATALSYLITQYIKEYSGKLSAFCGCGIAAGSGMACALTWLRGGDEEAVVRTLRNMAAGITGMICDGGNQGCTMKSIVAVDAAFRASELAMQGLCIAPEHGICAETPEQTMRNMGRIAAPGMVETESEIVRIMEDKLK